MAVVCLHRVEWEQSGNSSSQNKHRCAQHLQHLPYRPSFLSLDPISLTRADHLLPDRPVHTNAFYLSSMEPLGPWAGLWQRVGNLLLVQGGTHHLWRAYFSTAQSSWASKQELNLREFQGTLRRGRSSQLAKIIQCSLKLTVNYLP